MAVNSSGCLGPFLTTLFTTVLAPVLVSILTTEVKSHNDRPAAPEPGSAPAQATLAERTEVIAQGVGWTPDEAVQDAVRNALRSASAALVDPSTWTRQGTALFDVLLRNSQGLVLRCQEVRSGTAWHQGRQYHHRTLAVEVARRLLADRLRTAAQAVQ